jgi:hypothetical protein
VAISSTVCGSPTAVALNPEKGLEQVGCANLARLFMVRESHRRHYGLGGPAEEESGVPRPEPGCGSRFIVTAHMDEMKLGRCDGSRFDLASRAPWVSAWR